jgi:hypothetical protein
VVTVRAGATAAGRRPWPRCCCGPARASVRAAQCPSLALAWHSLCARAAGRCRWAARGPLGAARRPWPSVGRPWLAMAWLLVAAVPGVGLCHGDGCVSGPMWGSFHFVIHLLPQRRLPPWSHRDWCLVAVALPASVVPSQWRLCRCSSPAAHVTPLTCRPISVPHSTFPPSRGRPILMCDDDLSVFIPTARPLALCTSQHRAPTEPPKPSPLSTAWRSRAPFAFNNRATFASNTALLG